MSESAGAADREMDIIKNSLEYKINALKETFTGIWQNVFNREDLGTVVDFATGIAEVLDGITEKLGLFGSAIAAGGIAAGVMGLANAFKAFSAASGALTMVEALSGAFPGLSAAIGAFSTAMATTGGAAGVLHGALSGLWALIAAHPILAAVGAVALLAVAFDKMHESAKEANEKMENSFKAYDDAKQKVIDVNTELETTQTRINELEAKKGLTFVEQSELDNLREATELLQIQADLAEKEEVKAAKEAAKDTVNAYEKNFGKYLDVWEGNAEQFGIGDIYSAEGVKQMAEYYDRTNMPLLANGDQDIFPILASYYNAVKQRDKMYGEVKDLLKQDYDSLSTQDQFLVDDYNDTNEQIQYTTDLLWEHAGSLVEYKQNLEKIPVEQMTSEQVSTLGEIDSAIGMIYQTLDPGKWKQISFDKIFNTSKFAQAKQDLLDIALASENLGITEDDVKDIFGDYSGLEQALTDAGFSLSDVVNQINSEAEILDVQKVKENIKTQVEQGAEEAVEETEVEGTVDVEVEPEVTVKNNADERAKFNEWIDGLSDDYALAVNKLMNDSSIDTSSWDTAAYQAYVESLMTGSSEAQESVADLTGTIQDLSLVFNDSSDAGLTKAISSYKEQMNSLVSAREKWNKGELSVEDMIGLQQSFAELNEFDMSNFGSGIDTVIDRITGKLGEADSTFKDFKENIIDKDEGLKDALADISSITKQGFKDAESGVTEAYGESVNMIMDAAARAGLVNRNSTESVNGFIDALFESGIIQGKTGEITKKTTGIMADFEKAIKAVGGEETIAGRALITMRDNLLGLYDQTDEVKSAYTTLKDTLGTFSQYQTDVAAALKASKSATGLTAEQVQTLTTAYEKLDSFQPDKLFEKTANGIHLNEEEFKRLNKEVQNNTLAQMYSDLAYKFDELNDAKAAGQDTSGLEKDIADAQMLIAQYEGLTSALNAWQQAQSNGNERDSFESVAKGYEGMEKILNQGWYGDESLNAYLDLMLSASERTGDAVTDFEKLGQTIEGTGHSLKDYFTFEDGNLVSDGLFNFLDDVNAKMGDSFASIDENGNYMFDFTGEKLQQVAKEFGTTTEFIQLMERAMIDAGMAVEMSSSELSTMKETLEGLKSEGKISSDIELGDFDAATASAEELQGVIDKLSEEKARIEVESDGSEETQQTLETLDRTINSLTAQKVRTSIDVAVENGNSVEELLAMDDTTLAATLNVDASEVDTAREQLEALNGATESTTVTVTLESSQFEALTNTSQTVTVTYSVDAPEAPEYEDQSPQVTYGITAPDAPDYPDQNPKVTYSLSAPSQPIYNNIERTVTYTIKTVGTPPSGGGGVDGTAHVLGTAYARGDWGTKNGGIALGGELGQELVVRDGHFFTIGDNSAEFFRYRPGDIIFNAEQTREIFEKGKITHGAKRGNALAYGTAFDTGTGARRRKDSGSSNSGSGSGNGNGGNGNGGGNGNSGSGNGGNGNDNSSKSDNTIDWIERKLKYFADKVQRIADTITDYVSSSVKKAKLIQERSTISKEINANEKAYDKYMKYADKVDLSSSLKKKVRKGNYSISDYSEDTQKAIEKYKEYYDNAQECKDKVTELRNTQLELFEDLMNIPTEKAEKKIDKLKAKFDSLSASADAASTGMSGVSALMSLNEASIDSAKSDYLDTKNKNNSATSNLLSVSAKLTRKDKKKKKNADGTYKLPKNKKSKAYKRLKAYNNALKKSKSANSAYKSAKANYKQISDLYELQGEGETYNYQNALIDAETANMRSQNSANQTALKEANANLISAENANAKASSDVSKKAKSLSKSKDSKLASRIKKANGETIATKGLSGKALKQAKAYNKLVEEAKTKAQELTIAQDAQATAAQNAAQSQAELAQQIVQAEQDKFENIKTYYEAQSDYLDSIRDKQEAANDLKQTKGLMLTAKDYNKLINKNNEAITNLNAESASLKSQLASAVKSGNIKEGSEEWKKMKSEINEVEKATLDLQTQTEEYNNAIAQLPFDKIEKQLEYLDSISNLLSSKQALKEAKGLSLALSDYSESIAANDEQIVEYLNEYNEAIANVAKANANSEGVYGGKTAQEWQAEANGYMKSVTDMTKSNVELANSIAKLPFDKIEKQLEYLKAQSDYNESLRSLRTARGNDSSELDYQNKIAEAKDQQAQYESERLEAYSNYLKALANSEGVYGGKTAQEWMKEYNEFGTEINNISVDIEKIKDDLRDDVYWRTFERAHQSCERLQEVLSGINALIDDNSLFDKNGNLTDYGASRIANLVKSFENARTEVSNYSKDIANLNQLYSSGYYTEQEYKEKLNELQKGMLGSASDMKSYQDSIVEMYKTMAQSELDALNKLIDKRAEALNKKKAYYEYDKNIKKQTDDLQTLQAQLAALEGINSLEATAKRRKLELEITEKQEELDDTVQDHIFDLSQEALNDLKETLQDAFDEKWENISGNLKEIAVLMGEAKTLTTTGMQAINSTLTSMLSYYGINAKATGIDAAFASGTSGVSRRLRALIGEDGSEIATTGKGLILTLDKGDGVIPHEMTENLMQMAQGILPNIALNSIRLPDLDIAKLGETNVEQHYDSLIHIDGSADAATVEDIKRMTDGLLDKSYEYTSKKIHEGYIKAGGRRTI